MGQVIRPFYSRVIIAFLYGATFGTERVFTKVLTNHPIFFAKTMKEQFKIEIDDLHISHLFMVWWRGYYSLLKHLMFNFSEKEVLIGLTPSDEDAEMARGSQENKSTAPSDQVSFKSDFLKNTFNFSDDHPNWE